MCSSDLSESKQRKGENKDVRRKVKDAVLYEKFHVAIRLPILGCVVHCDRLLQTLDKGENKQRSTKNKSWCHYKICVEVWWDVPLCNIADRGTLDLDMVTIK